MKPQCSNQKTYGMTLMEVLVVIVALIILAVLLLPAFVPHHDGRQKMSCAINLRKIDISFRIWAGDNNDKYPMQISVTNGGAMEWVSTGNVVAMLQVMSNELSTPKILKCPQDKKTFIATNFESAFSAKNISYFVGVDADQKFPQRLLIGDDNFEVDQVPIKVGLLNFSTTSTIVWDATRHTTYKEHFWTRTKSIGYIAFDDGSVQQINNNQLPETFEQTGLATNHLAIP